MTNTPKLRRPAALPLHQRYLLQASLLQGDLALEAWQHWVTLIDFEKLDPASYSLLGLLYQNLQQFELEQLEHTYMPRLKGIYRRIWYVNQLTVKRLARLLEVLDAQNVEYLVMADGSLQSDPLGQASGYRSMNSLSLLVRSVNDSGLLRVLESQGWEEDGAPASRLQGFLRLCDRQDNALQLHQQIFWERPKEAVLQQVWEDAIPGSPLGKALGRTLSPTDQFLYLSRQLSQQHQSFQLHWIADAVLLLRQNSLDWDRLIAQAQQYKLIIPVRNMLVMAQPYLTDEVPVKIGEQLSSLRVAPWELIQYPILFRETKLILRSYIARFFRDRRPKST